MGRLAPWEAVLGSSLGCLGAFLGPFGAVLGLSWGPTRPSWGPLGGLSDCLWAILGRLEGLLEACSAVFVWRIPDKCANAKAFSIPKKIYGCGLSRGPFGGILGGLLKIKSENAKVVFNAIVAFLVETVLL